MSLKFIIKQEEELCAVAKMILEKYNSKVFLFYGEMGVGKTSFIKKFCKELGVSDVVSSPTFSIVNQYSNVNDDIIYHFDFYRTEKQDEVFDIGYEEYFFSSSYCFIEWPEKLEDLLPTNYLKINMKLDDNNRIINIKEYN
ncbi:MAG: tRNA (adenosine(37)-N6)-threonylcarbamoyltransferase complex ATPase subunit type 1 TsaE [Flavobacteriales bacterium]